MLEMRSFIEWITLVEEDIFVYFNFKLTQPQNELHT